MAEAVSTPLKILAPLAGRFELRVGFEGQGTANRSWGTKVIEIGTPAI
jgi:hypothetical protein